MYRDGPGGKLDEQGIETELVIGNYLVEDMQVVLEEEQMSCGNLMFSEAVVLLIVNFVPHDVLSSGEVPLLLLTINKGGHHQQSYDDRYRLSAEVVDSSST